MNKRLQRLRISSQFFFILFFFFLLLQSGGADVARLPFTGFFFYLDPLFLWVSLTSGPLLHAFLFALIPLALTVVLGRFFCGWVCPFGGLNQFFTWLARRGPRRKNGAHLRSLRLKYILLLALIVASLFGAQWLGWLDPFSLITRSGAVTLIPGMNFIAERSLAVGAGEHGLAKLVKPLYTFAREHVLTLKQRTFQEPELIAVLFFLILGLNFWRRRFFCNTLCPLGALYGFLSRQALIRLQTTDACRRCNACAANCTYYGSPYQDYLKSECLLCFNCLTDCRDNAIRVRFGWPSRLQREGVDVGRRRLIGSAAVGLAVAAVPGLGIRRRSKSRPFIRPPGSQAERDFLKRCLRCGACVQACPTNAIQPAVFQAGLEGMWTPVLVPLNGYCEYECFRCTQVCPTHAIARLTLEEKKRFKIGTAVIDRSACYTYADGYNCAVCEEHCPVPDKAIKFRKAEVSNYKGQLRIVKQIYVDPKLCIGCGICENVCPRIDAPAIKVSAEEEQRETDLLTF